MRAQLPNFFDIIKGKQETIISINNEDRLVERAKFGKHLILANLSELFTRNSKQGDTEGLVQTIENYLGECGIDEGTGIEKLIAYVKLRQMNSLQISLSFLEQQEEEPLSKPAYSYEGRIWALWIHKLASVYGWSKNQIFSLWPEEVLCFLQEILIAEYEQAEEKRVLSELAYTYDKNAKKYRYIPLPKPGWMTEEKKEAVLRIRASILPVGEIVDLESKYAN